MKLKTVGVSFQLRVPAHLYRGEIVKIIREAMQRAEWGEISVVNLSGDDAVRLYRDRVEVFMP